LAERLELRELKRISRILLLANANTIEKEISKIANSESRKKMWVLIDGKRLQKDIATEIGVTQPAVSYFLAAASAADLIEYHKGEAPSRILDYVPPSWIDLTIKEEKHPNEDHTTSSLPLSTAKKTKEKDNA